ncbi:ferric-dicitrate binding protein FerR (iron transport regulator) [Rhodoblastus sphagnicola]|nr:FecR family protein [Rhodoblastus sphagnicola]MBB4197876.1 ferric-dicitrate binding protein FerR (iron transport regulator) [Rhodoblastus sphagnicola]
MRFLKTLPAVAMAGALLAPACSAEDRIGAATVANNEVVRVEGGGGAAIHRDDDVFRDESVRTGPDSSAKFVFRDATNLALGPVSTVKLDRFVYSDDATYAHAAVNLAKGVFRFSSGGSPKEAYEIKTGNATIGVRGTILDISSEPGRTVVTLVEGQAVVCPRSRYDGDPRKLDARALEKYHCGELLHPGDAIVVSSGAAKSGARPFSFADAACGSDPALCSREGYASLRGSDVAPDGKLCGR